MMKSIEPLEAASLAVERELAGLVARPDGMERAVHVEDAEQVVEPVVERERVALDVEEQVAGRRRRERGQTASELDRVVGAGQEELVLEPAVAASLELDPGLLADPLQGARADVLERRLHRQRQVAERLERRDAALPSGPAAAAREMPGTRLRWSSARRRVDAFGRPATDVAMVDRLRVRRRVGG